MIRPQAGLPGIELAVGTVGMLPLILPIICEENERGAKLGTMEGGCKLKRMAGMLFNDLALTGDGREDAIGNAIAQRNSLRRRLGTRGCDSPSRRPSRRS